MHTECWVSTGARHHALHWGPKGELVGTGMAEERSRCFSHRVTDICEKNVSRRSANIAVIFVCLTRILDGRLSLIGSEILSVKFLIIEISKLCNL